jgi:hypothetical protein
MIFSVKPFLSASADRIEGKWGLFFKLRESPIATDVSSLVESLSQGADGVRHSCLSILCRGDLPMLAVRRWF